MPFALNDATRFISPTKTLEYIAAGKPVVSTVVRDVRAMFSDVVTIASDADELLSGCRAALAETPQRRNERIAEMASCVWRYSWDETAEAVHRAIEKVLDAAPRRQPAVAGVSLPAGLRADHRHRDARRTCRAHDRPRRRGRRRAEGRERQLSVDLLDLVQWPAMAVTVLAAWLVASDREGRRLAGFGAFLLSNLLWIAWGWHSRAWALIVLQVCLAAMNIRGARKAEAHQQEAAAAAE